MDMKITSALQKVFDTKTHASLLEFEKLLERSGCSLRTVGDRSNQKAAMMQATESSTSFRERAVNQWDAHKDAARLIKGKPETTPIEEATSWFVGEDGEYHPDADIAHIPEPFVEVLFEPKEMYDGRQRHRYAMKQPEDVCNVCNVDFGPGIEAVKIPETILAINSGSKGRNMTSTGSLGWGGIPSLKFSDITLIASVSRFAEKPCLSFTVVKAVKEEGSKFERVWKYFVNTDNLPFQIPLESINFDSLHDISHGGTIVLHCAFDCGKWIHREEGYSRQNYLYGRISKEFFGYPLPIHVLAYNWKDSKKNGRLVPIPSLKTRLLADKREGSVIKIPERVLSFSHDGIEWGKIKVSIFHCKQGNINYTGREHPIVLTLNGIKHGQWGVYFLEHYTDLPETYNKLVVGVEIQSLHTEMMDYIFDGGRESVKECEQSKKMLFDVLDIIKNDPILRQLENDAQSQKVNISDEDFDAALTDEVYDEYEPEGAAQTCGDGDGEKCGGEDESNGGYNGKGKPRPTPPPMPENDPPTIFEVYQIGSPAKIYQGGSRIVKFKTDARSTAYSFHNGMLTYQVSGAISYHSHGEINEFGYGYLKVQCPESTPIGNTGSLTLVLNSPAGALVQKVEFVAIESPRITVTKKRPKTPIKTEFYALDADAKRLTVLLGGRPVAPGSAPQFDGFDGISEPSYVATPIQGTLFVRINASNPRLVAMLDEFKSDTKRKMAVKRVCLDIVTDALQHNLRPTGSSDKLLDIVTKYDAEQRLVHNTLNLHKAVKLTTNSLKE